MAKATTGKSKGKDASAIMKHARKHKGGLSQKKGHAKKTSRNRINFDDVASSPQPSRPLEEELTRSHKRQISQNLQVLQNRHDALEPQKPTDYVYWADNRVAKKDGDWHIGIRILDWNDNSV